MIELGEFNQTRLLDAIVKVPVVALGQFEWTITDVVDKRSEKMPYVFGNLAKYSKVGRVTIVDEPANPSIERTCPGKPGHASHLKRSPYGEINSCSLKTESSSMQQ